MEKIFGRTLRAARKKADQTLEELAAHVGVTYPAVQQWEAGVTRPTLSNLKKVSEVLQAGDDLTAAWLADANAEGDTPKPAFMAPVYPSRPRATKVEPAVDAMSGLLSRSKVRILGQAVGGERGSDFRYNGETVGYANRPAGIANLKNVFAIYVRNDSVSPKYDSGDIIFIDPDRPPTNGDYVVLELFSEDEGEPDLPGEAFIKKLVRRGPEKIIVLQHNPEQELVFDASAVKHLYRVIPWRELLGV